MLFVNLALNLYGLDSEMVASFCESFATHVDLPKDKWFKYHPPIEVNIVVLGNVAEIQKFSYESPRSIYRETNNE